MSDGLITNHSGYALEVGCDEAGRGCLAGPVFAAAVILPLDFDLRGINDSKILKKDKRNELRKYIEATAIDFAVASMSPSEIDTYNILWASVRSMHKAIKALQTIPEYILVDGNKFLPYGTIEHFCIIGGDGNYASIAAASILAKTYRDEYMERLALKCPGYDWENNKGYPTKKHKDAILALGPTIYHRKTFKWY